MEASKRNIIIYGIIAVILAGAATFAAISLIPSSASLRLSLLVTNYSAVYPYETSFFFIIVNNTGGSQITNLPVDFYLNGSELRGYKVSIPPHNHVLLGANYTYIVNGTYGFEAIADPGHILNIANRSGTEQGVDITVKRPQAPNVYTSIPNTNITGTQSFTFSSAGTLSTAVIADKYNISSLNSMFLPAGITDKIFENLYPYVALTNGAFAKYKNNTSAYTAWLQGTVNPPQISYILQSFYLPQKNLTVNGNNVYLTKVNNQTSLCAFYQNGWTKIVSYFNDSMHGTCATLASVSYQPTESNVLVAALKANPTLTHYQSGFVYTNSSGIGSAILYNTTGRLGVMNIFNNSYGFFTSLASTRVPPVNVINSTGSCIGLIADQNSTHVCSTYIVPKSGTIPSNYSLVNTTMVTGNYIFDLYSLVTVSNLFSAHYNGAKLLEAMHVNQTTQRWSSGFSNTCTLGSNAPLGCAVNSFNYTDNISNVTITDNTANAVTLNTASCYFPGEQHNATIAQTILPNAKAMFSLQCYSLALGYASAITSYDFSLNYTVNGKAATSYGFMNITNFGQG